MNENELSHASPKLRKDELVSENESLAVQRAPTLKEMVEASRKLRTDTDSSVNKILQLQGDKSRIRHSSVPVGIKGNRGARTQDSEEGDSDERAKQFKEKLVDLLVVEGNDHEHHPHYFEHFQRPSVSISPTTGVQIIRETQHCNVTQSLDLLVKNMYTPFKVDDRLELLMERGKNRHEKLDKKAAEAFYDLLGATVRSHTYLPMEQETEDGIKKLLNKQLCSDHRLLLKDLFEEAKDEYIESGRIAAMDHILKPFQAIAPKAENDVDFTPLASKESVALPTPWRDRFLKTRAWLESNLFITHKLVLEICSLWKKYCNVTLLSVEDLKKNSGSSRPTGFRSNILVQSEKCREKIVSGFYVDVLRAFARYYEQNDGNVNVKLYTCGHVFVTNKIISIIMQSTELYLKLFSSGRDNDSAASYVPKFLVRSWLKEIDFEAIRSDEESGLDLSPSVDDVKECLFDSLEILVKTVEYLPRIDATVQMKDVRSLLLNSDHFRPSGLQIEDIAVKLDKEFVENAQHKLKECIDGCEISVARYIEGYKPYRTLFDKDMASKLLREVSQYDLSDEDTFMSMISKVHSAKEEAISIQYLPRNQSMQIIELVSDELHKTLFARAMSKSQLYLSQLAASLMKQEQELCVKFEEIEAQAEKTSENFQEMAQLQEYMKDALDRVVPLIMTKLENVQKLLLVLMDHQLLTKEHMDLNTVVFNWPTRLQPIVEFYQEKMGRSVARHQELLKQRRLRFEEELEAVAKQIHELEEVGDLEEMPFYSKRVQTLQKQLQQASETVQQFNKEEALYGWPPSIYPRREAILALLQPFQQLYSNVVQFQKSTKKWLDGSLLEVEADSMVADLEAFRKTFYKLQTSFTEAPAPFSIVKQIQCKVDDLFRQMPLIKIFCNPGLKDRHWSKMSTIAGINMLAVTAGDSAGTTLGFNGESSPAPLNVSNALSNNNVSQLAPASGATAVSAQVQPSLRHFLQLDLSHVLDRLSEVSESATKEFTLERTLRKMMNEWSDVELVVVPYRESGTFVVGAVDEIQQLLDDQIVKTQSMRGSPYIGPFELETKAWELKLLLLQDILDEWLKVQATWLYLDPIFSSPDISNQMPEEGRQFQQVDVFWRKLMQKVQVAPQVLRLLDIQSLKDQLQQTNATLEIIQKGLNSYLELKRLYFPRFFFLSNDEMLEILSETKDPTRVQPHLKKCFEGVNTLEFSQPNNDIISLRSSEGESLKLNVAISTEKAKGQVEKWLLQVENGMMESIQSTIKASIEAYMTLPRDQWILNWPGQVVLCVSQIFWTLDAENAFRKNSATALSDYLNTLTNELNKVVTIVRGKNLSSMARLTLGALIVIDVHARDVIQKLQQQGVMSEKDFDWQNQLRYYWQDNHVVVKMINANKQYGYEYLGNSPRLVITPLTDRCYRTLIGALHLNLGGAPEGPAGTGKTETTKDLAKAIAKQCVVFNCSDGLDYLAMGKFFKGLASAGAWACFDEFNRIDLEVLSVVAQQILTIQRAVAMKVQTFLFERTNLSLNPACAVFITMNPGYAGRSELPDNLKSLFRPVAMMVPDYTLIAEISLYSFGFIEARSLAVKITATYRLCSEQLSSQDHYDYGMRAVKSVLTAAGALKLRYPDFEETILVLRSINEVNLPKFLAQDVLLFRGILSDLFPGITLPNPDYTTLRSRCEQACRDLNLQPVPSFLEKVFQIYEMMLVRHGFMLVGEPFSGKSSAYKVLAKALTVMAKNDELPKQTEVLYRVINPKSITMGQLYGQFDPTTHEWKDGVLANLYRAFASSQSPERKWLIFDGPVDAIWIENMNTVLDDNKKLCLMSGEIIQLSNSMSVMFEVMDLAVASPATVSRCGMIYMEPSLLGWRPLVQSWLDLEGANPNEKEVKERLSLLIDWLVPSLLAFVKTGGQLRELSPSSESNLVTSMIRYFDALKILEQNESAAILSKFVFAVIWAFGGNLDAESQLKFNEFIRTAFKNREIEEMTEIVPQHRLFQAGVNPLPTKGNVFDYKLELSSGGSIKETGDSAWKPWFDQNSTDTYLRIPAGADYNQIMVPTKDTHRLQYIVKLLVSAAVPLLVVGPTGTGKSKCISKTLLEDLDSEQFLPMFLMFSARTEASVTQSLIMSKLDKRRKGVFGAPLGKKSVVFVDDLNMPLTEKYGAQPPLELLRQFLDQGLWYDLQDTSSELHMVDVQCVAAMAPSGGGRNSMTPRLARHFVNLAVNSFEDEVLTHIFESLLIWHFTVRNSEFENGVVDLARPLVKATLKIYNWALTNLLPTPSKTHYTFNLRDFSKVIQGITLSSPRTLSSASQAIRLWTHEIYRVYSDRLVCQEDRDLLFEQIKVVTNSDFNSSVDGLFSHLSGNSSSHSITDTHLRSLIFGDFAHSRSKKEYREQTDLQEATANIKAALADYNNLSNAPMNLVLFRFALEHVARISRVLRLPNGHCLLVGVGGSGRQSLSKIAAFIAQYDVMQIELVKGYGVNEWREDLKKVLRNAGISGRPTTFLFTDTQIKQESFIEDISSILNAGDVPNLWQADERQDIIEKISKEAFAHASQTSPMAVYQVFLERVKQNLHLILCFSPIGDGFRSRLRDFSALVNCCTIDYFTAWPKDALQAVAETFLSDVNFGGDISRVSIVEMCELFHESTIQLSERFKAALLRYNYVTPTSYLELIQSFKSLYAKQKDLISAQRKRYTTGLEKVAFAAASVGRMQVELSELRPKLVKTGEQTTAMLATIQVESAEAESSRAVVAQDEAVASKKAELAQSIKDECEGELAEALPLLNAALAALDTLKKSDIDLVKSMKNPPSGVKLVMEAVCVIKNIKPDKMPDPAGTGKMINDYWKTSLKMLSDPRFLDTLRTFDKDNISPLVMKKIRTEFMENPEFKPDKVRNASSAAEGLCSWILAMEAYDRVAKVVEPKQQALAEAEQELALVMEGLQDKRNQLKLVQDRLDGLNAKLAELESTKQSLETQVDSCSKQLDRAQKLLSGLGGERERWNSVVAGLDRQEHELVGDVLISAGVMSYLGAFTQSYRLSCIGDWVAKCVEKNIPCSNSQSFSLEKVLGDPIETRAWIIAGLPPDKFSIDNGVMVRSARRWPLMIDPQGQANKWIRNYERDNNLQIIRLTDNDFVRSLENAITFGAPVLIENIKEELDPILEPLLQKVVFKSNGVVCIKLGDKTLEYSENFRLYITTKLSNPHYLPELSTKVTLLNFMITAEGLEDQLLGLVVAKERPELEEEKAALIIQSAENRRKLKEIEDSILEILSSSEGNILENEDAINVLSSSKIVANELGEKQRIAEETERKIDETRESYRQIANHAGMLYFCITDIAAFDPMYKYSSSWFVDLFVATIANSPKSTVLKKRLKNLESWFTLSLYNNVCRSLFEKDKLLFSFLLCTRILQNKGELDDLELRFLLVGTAAYLATHSTKLEAMVAKFPNPDIKQIPEKVWRDILMLPLIFSSEHQSAFYLSLIEAFSTQTHEWLLPVLSAAEPRLQSLASITGSVIATNSAADVASSGTLGSSITAFQKLILLKLTRPETMVAALQEFVKVKLGHQFVEPTAFNLASIFEESVNKTPLIFILSPGVDPMTQLLKFADDKGFTGRKFNSISLGQGQGPIATSMVKQGQKDGHWVVLQNCHLAVSWMSTLEKIVEDMSSPASQTIHKDFRLWLTSYPSEYFPVSVLQASVKMTNEAPKGIKSNLLKSYSMDPICDDSFYNDNKRLEPFQKLVFALCLFHSVVQERRNFGPLGWNIPYEFNDSDLRISLRQLAMFLNETPNPESGSSFTNSSDDVPLKALAYLTGECNYGGRVTDDHDRRTLTNLLSTFYCPEVLQSNFKFSPSGLYTVPIKRSREDIADYIQQLPLSQQPEIFGIHENGDISRQARDTNLLFESLLKTQEQSARGAGGSAGKSMDQVSIEIAEGVLSKLPEPFDIEEATRRYPVNYHESMNTVLVQEMIRFNGLIKLIRNSLVNVKKAVQGLVVMSAELETVSRSLVLGKLPQLWASKSYPSLKPLGSYIDDLLERLLYFQKWFDEGVPLVFWMSGFFFTQSFITATLQNYARQNRYPIDELGIAFEVQTCLHPSEITHRPERGVYVSGIFLEGARWNLETSSLAESRPKQLYDPLPIVWFKPSKSCEISCQNTYACPVYKTSSRRGTLSTTGHSTNFVITIRLPTDKPEKHWVLRGLAALLQMDD